MALPLEQTLESLLRLLIVRRPQVRKLIQKIAVRSNLTVSHPSVSEHGQELAGYIVRQRPARMRKRCWPPRVKGKNVGQQLSRLRHCLLLRVAARVFQLVREGTHETIIIAGLRSEVRLALFSRQEDG